MKNEEQQQGDKDSNQTISSAKEKEAEVESWRDLLFSVRKSVRYHSKRAARLDFWAKCINIITALAGFSAVALVMGKHEDLYMIFGVAVALLAMANIIFDFSSKARLHSELKRRFCELEKKMIEYTAPDEKILIEKTKERLSIEIDEPDVIVTLDLECYNEQATSQGYSDLCKIHWFRSLFCYFFQLDLPLLKPELES